MVVVEQEEQHLLHEHNLLAEEIIDIKTVVLDGSGCDAPDARTVDDGCPARERLPERTPGLRES